MTQTTLLFNVPQPDDLFKPGTQNARLYTALLEDGSVTNVRMRDFYVLSHTRRISDIREALKPYCMDVKKERVSGGVYSYRLTGVKG